VNVAVYAGAIVNPLDGMGGGGIPPEKVGRSGGHGGGIMLDHAKLGCWCAANVTAAAAIADSVVVICQHCCSGHISQPFIQRRVTGVSNR